MPRYHNGNAKLSENGAFLFLVHKWESGGRYRELLLGIGGFCLATERLSRAVVPSAAGQGHLAAQTPYLS